MHDLALGRRRAATAKARWTTPSGRRSRCASAPTAAPPCSRISCSTAASPAPSRSNAAGRRFVNEIDLLPPLRPRHVQGARDGAEHPRLPRSPTATALRQLRPRHGAAGRQGARALPGDGYLTEAPTLAELAGRLGIDAGGLAETVAGMNGYAETGIDPEFGRGTTAYHRVNGDASRGLPNPNLGPIGAPPFYAVRLLPGDIGAATGLVTDENARVLGPDDRPIGGPLRLRQRHAVGDGRRLPRPRHHHRPGHRLRLHRRAPRRCRRRPCAGRWSSPAREAA